MNEADASNDIGLRELWSTVWSGRNWIVSITAVATVLAVVYALLTTPIYRSEALVQPRQESKSGSLGLGALAAQFGGLADLAGVSLGGGGDRAVAIATLRSRALVQPFLRDKNLLPKLYSESWDSDSNTWKTQDPKDVPSLWQAYDDFTRNVFRVTEDKKTGFVTVAVEWKDPVEAQEWVSELIARTNAYLKNKAIEEGERNLAYLESQSRNIGQVELQKALYGLVEVELKKVMVAKAGEEYAFRIIDPAVVPERKIRPKRLKIAVTGLLLGGFVGVCFVLARSSFRNV